MKNYQDAARKFGGMPKVSYGRCIRRGCRSTSDLADGLCVNCWDRTSYKCDLEKESEDCIDQSEKSEPFENHPFRAKTGNKKSRSNSRY